jgi:hypothetical protein
MRRGSLRFVMFATAITATALVGWEVSRPDRAGAESRGPNQGEEKADAHEAAEAPSSPQRVAKVAQTRVRSRRFDPSPRASATDVVVVRVLDDRQQPIADASVGPVDDRFVDVDGAVRERTDANGAAVFDLESLDGYRFSARAPGLVPATTALVDSDAGRIGPFTVVLRPARTITGRVVDARDGSPIPGAVIGALEETLDFQNGEIVRQAPLEILATTGPEGRFEAVGIAGNEARDSDGWTKHGSSASLSGHGLREFSPKERPARVVAGLVVSKEGRRPEHVDVAPGDFPDLDLGDVALEPLYEVTVRVVGAWSGRGVGLDMGDSGREASSVADVEHPVDRSPSEPLSTIVRFIGVPGPRPGVTPRASCETMTGDFVSVEVEFRDAFTGYAPATLVLPATGSPSLSWMLTLTDVVGRPMRDWDINAEPLGGSGHDSQQEVSARTDAEGRATLEAPRCDLRLSGNELRIIRSDESGVVSESLSRFDLGILLPPKTGDGEARLTVPDHRKLVYRFVDEAGAPIEADEDRWLIAPTVLPRNDVSFGDQGHLRRENNVVLLPAPPETRLVCHLHGYDRKEEPLWPPPDDPATPHLIRLRKLPACRLRLKVVDSAGAARAYVGVVAFLSNDAVFQRPDRFGAPVQDVASDDTGVAVLDLHVGEWDIKATPFETTVEGSAIVRLRLDAPETSHTLVLRPSGSVHIQAPTRVRAGVDLKLALLEPSRDPVFCVADAAGAWTAHRVPSSRRTAALLAKTDLPKSVPGRIGRIAWDGYHASEFSLLTLSKPFIIGEGDVRRFALAAPCGTLHIRCDGKGRSASVVIESLEGGSIALDDEGAARSTLRGVVSQRHATIVLPPGPYSVAIDDPDYQPFRTTFSLPEDGDATVAVPTRIRR